VSFNYQVIIPARYASTRLPGKALLDIGGKPLIQHVYESAMASSAERVIIATDDKRIEKLAIAIDAEVVMTSSSHGSGTDRIAEVIVQSNMPDATIIVNVQGDEFDLPPAIIDQVATALHEHQSACMATLCEKITSLGEVADPDVVKVIFDKDNRAIYFSRSAIPWQKEPSEREQGFFYQAYRHIGIYAYRAGFLKTYSCLPHCPLEDSEKLEQLRAIYHGYKIHVEEACDKAGIGVDTEGDLELARKIATAN